MGRIEIKSINVPYLNKERKLRIYIPEQYDTDSSLRFPVLYMHDGQNMYLDEDAYGGTSWKAKETLELLEKEGITNGILLVGIDNDGDRRLDEYSPWLNEIEVNMLNRTSWGGEGDSYADFIVNTLKPYIDGEYRTKKEKEHTAIAGSSMGGYISVYIAIKYADIFSKIGAFSTASWFNETEFLNFMNQAKPLLNQKYFIQIGTDEGRDYDTHINNLEKSQMYINATLKLQRALLNKGVSIDNMELIIGAGEYHVESFWAKHFPSFIKFIS